MGPFWDAYLLKEGWLVKLAGFGAWHHCCLTEWPYVPSHCHLRTLVPRRSLQKLLRQRPIVVSRQCCCAEPFLLSPYLLCLRHPGLRTGPCCYFKPGQIRYKTHGTHGTRHMSKHTETDAPARSALREGRAKQAAVGMRCDRLLNILWAWAIQVCFLLASPR